MTKILNQANEIIRIKLTKSKQTNKIIHVLRGLQYKERKKHVYIKLNFNGYNTMN